MTHAATFVSPPIRLSQVSSVRLSPEVFRLGQKLRIRDLSSGKSIVVEISSAESYLPTGILSRVVASPNQEWLPEFSVLAGAEGASSLNEPDLPPALRLRAAQLENKNLATSSYAPSTWRVLGYRVLKSPSGLLFLEVSDGVKTVFVTPEQAARRIEVRDAKTLKKLFDLGWRSLSIQRYDIGQEAFEGILKRAGRSLSEQQAAQAHLGLALSLYHREGCSKALDAHLLEADKDVANQDDVSYYTALCAMNDENYDQAEVLFKKLVEKQHQNYSEASAFYLGVIAETDERYDDAEAAYLDTIDFSSDNTLIGIAKTRLENVRALRAMSSLESKWISGGLGLGASYDTNVVALPQDVTPASVGLSKQAALLSSDLMFISLAPPWSRFFTHKLNYTFLLNNHFDSEIGRIYDSNIHDLGTQVGFRSEADTKHGLSYSWNSISLGPIGKSAETLRTKSFSYSLKFLRGSNPEQPDSELEWGYKYTAIRPTLEAVSTQSNLEANAHQISLKYQQRRNAPHVYGPELSAEWRSSKGSENSLWDYRIGANWDYYFGNMQSPWYLSQNGYFSYKPYYDTVLNRHDYTLSYTGALGRTWGASIDTRLQLTGTFNFSTVKSAYQYHQQALSLLVTAFF